MTCVTRLGHGDLELRRYEARDEASVVDLLVGSLGIAPDVAPLLWRWKHGENAFGTTPAWVAVDRDRVVAMRPFLSWEFERGGRVIRAVRAVDTATHPDYRGRGLFRTLTERALAELEADGIAFVFNTPNDQSRPGYLKMGWKTVGRVPVRARFRSLASVVRAARARTFAELESDPSNARAGIPAADALKERGVLDALLAGGGGPRLSTHRTSAFLVWRYGSAPFGYRALTSERGLDDGVVFFRLRRRGRAVEAAVCDVLVPEGGGRLAAGLLRRLASMRGADYAVRLASDNLGRHGYVQLPGQGPVLLWRHLCDEEMPVLDSWRLCLGDVELF